ncbi:MAG: polysaccharide biosynthesis tyrosine autokinase [Polyangiaceae bacterium]|nr:polysaccharide biosynthesis tyrosine autokinase [Polyangiaceae bacterium]MCW5791047.1 polysaccharide biosynthesis tyrosine autokinase [Polyangiaceae bacterium]
MQEREEAEGGDSQGVQVTLSAVSAALRKSWGFFVGAVALTLVVAVVITFRQTEIFRSSGTIQIDPTPPRPLGNEIQSVVEMGTGAYLNNREYYETQYRILESRRLAKRVVQTLSLHRDPAFLRNRRSAEGLPIPEVSVDDAAAVLTSRLAIEPQKQSRLVTIAFRDADPVRAQRIVTTVIESYRKQNLDDVLDSTNSAVDWLRGQEGTLKRELESQELDLHKYKKDKNILSLSMDEQSNMLRAEMGKLNELLTEVRAKREELSARRSVLTGINEKDPADLPSTELLASPLLQRLREGYIDSVKQRDGLLAEGKGALHPEVAAASSRVETTRAAVVREIKNVKGGVDRDYTAASRQVNGLQSLYNAANKRALELNLMEIEFNRLRRSKDNTERLYSLVRDRTKESDLTLMMRVNNIHVVDEATLPNDPVQPSLPVNLAAGLVAGVVLGAGLVVGREFLDKSVKTLADVDPELPLLGVLPALEHADPGPKRSRRERRGRGPAGDEQLGLVVHTHPTSGAAEAARAIRTNIMFMSPDNPYKTLLITSAAPMEGKTTLACCIATAMAQAGQRVVLVDCDMRRPRIHRVFGSSGGAGITNALLDIAHLDQGLFETEVPRLSVLPCGPIPPNPAELLHSESFGKVLDELRARFDRVVIDSPPLGPVTDGVVLSTRVDGTVFVVRAFKTRKDIARRAVRSIRNVKGTLVGGVLNGASASRNAYGEYGMQYYYQSAYASDEDDAAQS